MALYFFCVGIPGSGKSTAVAKLGCAVVCPDTLRVQMPTATDAQVFARARELVANHLRAGEDVVFDATNTIRRWRQENIAAGKTLASRTVCLWFTTSVDECLRRHDLRRRQGSHITLGPEVIVRMERQLLKDPPRVDEGFDLILTVDTTKGLVHATH